MNLVQSFIWNVISYFGQVEGQFNERSSEAKLTPRSLFEVSKYN